MKYKPGDWVVLGPGGSGWASDLVGKKAQIADIGPHLGGSLLCGHYDFYVHPNEDISPERQICDPKGGGYSASIAGLVRRSYELENVLVL